MARSTGETKGFNVPSVTGFSSKVGPNQNATFRLTVLGINQIEFNHTKASVFDTSKSNVTISQYTLMGKPQYNYKFYVEFELENGTKFYVIADLSSDIARNNTDGKYHVLGDLGIDPLELENPNYLESYDYPNTVGTLVEGNNNGPTTAIGNMLTFEISDPGLNALLTFVPTN
jgi:hypothetical protein